MKASLMFITPKTYLAPEAYPASNSEPAPNEISNALSIENLIGSCHNSLVSFLRRRLRVGEDARDVAQEAYIRLMQYEGSKDVKSPESLLFRIAINIANDMGRADKVRHVSDHCDIDGLEFDSGSASPEREVSAGQQLDLLYATIEELPPKCRQVFLLSRFQNMTYPQIAEHCGISVKMVEKHISRALAICAAKSN